MPYPCYCSNIQSLTVEAKQVEPLAEVKTNGRITFNKPAAALFESKPFCMLAFDRENKAVGILPLENKELNTFVIRHTNRGAYGRRKEVS